MEKAGRTESRRALFHFLHKSLGTSGLRSDCDVQSSTFLRRYHPLPTFFTLSHLFQTVSSLLHFDDEEHSVCLAVAGARSLPAASLAFSHGVGTVVSGTMGKSLDAAASTAGSVLGLLATKASSRHSSGANLDAGGSGGSSANSSSSSVSSLIGSSSSSSHVGGPMNKKPSLVLNFPWASAFNPAEKPMGQSLPVRESSPLSNDSSNSSNGLDVSTGDGATDSASEEYSAKAELADLAVITALLGCSNLGPAASLKVQHLMAKQVALAKARAAAGTTADDDGNTNAAPGPSTSSSSEAGTSGIAAGEASTSSSSKAANANAATRDSVLARLNATKAAKSSSTNSSTGLAPSESSSSAEDATSTNKASSTDTEAGAENCDKETPASGADGSTDSSPSSTPSPRAPPATPAPAPPGAPSDDFAELQLLMGRGVSLTSAEASRVQTLMAAAGARAKAGGSEVKRGEDWGSCCYSRVFFKELK